jgi:hypothetical protein
MIERRGHHSGRFVGRCFTGSRRPAGLRGRLVGCVGVVLIFCRASNENNHNHNDDDDPREVVAFRGSFLADADTLELLRLEVLADAIPPELGLDRVSSVLEYARVTIGAWNGLLPKSSELTMIALNGVESRNRTTLGACREYRTESRMIFDAPPAEDKLKHVPQAAEEAAGRRVMELSLDSEIAFELHTFEAGRQRYSCVATMMDAEPAPGLIRQAKQLNPTFSRDRRPRMEILVNQVQRGQGVLQWEARRPRIRKALRMRWLLEDLRPVKDE